MEVNWPFLEVPVDRSLLLFEGKNVLWQVISLRDMEYWNVIIYLGDGIDWNVLFLVHCSMDRRWEARHYIGLSVLSPISMPNVEAVFGEPQPPSN